MAAVSQTISWDALVSTTLKNYTPKIEDNLFTNVTLLYWLKEAGHIEKVNGGEQPRFAVGVLGHRGSLRNFVRLTVW